MNTILMLQGSITNILQNWNFFLSLWIIQGAFTVLTLWLLSDTLLDKDVLSVLSFLGGILGFTLFSLVITIGKITPSPALGMAITVIALLILLWRRQQFHSLMTSNLARLIIFFLFILLLRLIFIQDLLVPAYSDSVLHLQIVRDLLNPEQAPQAFYRLSSDPRHYYHVGFHSLAAFLSGGTSTSSAFLIPVFSALRLAKFNNDTRQSDSFIGVPTPANAILICSLPLILNLRNGYVDENSNMEIAMVILNKKILIGLVILLSYLLIAELPLIALKFKNFGWKGNEVRFVFLILACVIVGISIHGRSFYYFIVCVIVCHQ